MVLESTIVEHIVKLKLTIYRRINRERLGTQFS